MRTQPDNIIRSLEIHSSRLNKEAIIQAAHEEGLPEFFEGVTMALDAMITFGVKQVPEATVDGQGLAWTVFKELADNYPR
jgi:DNA ligase 1